MPVVRGVRLPATSTSCGSSCRHHCCKGADVGTTTLTVAGVLGLCAGGLQHLRHRRGARTRRYITEALDQREAQAEDPLEMHLTIGREEAATRRFQDALYLRFTQRYRALPTGPSDEYMVELLHAFRTGNLQWLFQEVQRRNPGDWDFVFPPAKMTRAVVSSSDTEVVDPTEGWCRSPLSLLVRPAEGAFSTQFLPGVPRDARLQLVREALQSGVCSPHFEGEYWSCAAIHAAMVGDVQMLSELHDAGLDMQTVAVEWGVNEVPSFTVVHAAAMNGHVEALRWLADTFDNREWLDREDPTGRSALEYAIVSARSEAAAKLLVSKGCDPFRWDITSGESALSVAIELMPHLAEEFLRMKTRPAYAWWGTPVVRLDFEGVAIHPELPGQLRFTSRTGDRASIESLIARVHHPELAATPVLARLCSRKWDSFARVRYWKLLATFIVISIPYTLEGTVGAGLSADGQLLLLSAVVGAWLSYGRAKLLQLRARGKEAFAELRWSQLDSMVLLLLPFGVIAHFFDAMNLSVQATVDTPASQVALMAPFAAVGYGPDLQPAAAVLDAVLAILCCVRLLRYLSVFNFLRIGSYLNSILGVLASAAQPLFFLAVVICCFGVAFLELFRYGAREGATHPVPEMNFSGYGYVLVQLIKWLFEPAEAFEAFEDMVLNQAGFVLFLLYYCAAVLGSLRLLQDSTGETLESSKRIADKQWLDVRSRVVDDVEEQMIAGSDEDREELAAFYKSLRDGGELVPQSDFDLQPGAGGDPGTRRKAAAARATAQAKK